MTRWYTVHNSWLAGGGLDKKPGEVGFWLAEGSEYNRRYVVHGKWEEEQFCG